MSIDHAEITCKLEFVQAEQGELRKDTNADANAGAGANAIMIIELNRPDRGNGLTPAMQTKYFDALDAAQADDRVKCIVVTGGTKSRHFCVGADMDALADIEEDNKKSNTTRSVGQMQALEIEKPIIMAIHGGCAGLGFILAMMGDIRFAQEGTKFTTSFAKRGLVAEHGIAWLLPRIVGIGNAMDLLMSARVVLASEAHRMNLVNFVIPKEKSVVEEALAYAREMIKNTSPASIAEIKSQVYSAMDSDRQTSSTSAQALLAKAFKHPDFSEGIKSWNEKRNPRFRGVSAGKIRNVKL